MKKIFVTGASGQLGRKLTKKLVELGYPVRAHFRSKEKADKWLPDGAKAVYGDLLMPGWLYDACDDIDTVIHCAAWVSLGPRNYDMMYQINVNGTRAVADACRKSGVRRLIHISTVGAIGGTDNGNLLDEDSTFNLENLEIPYFTTKYLAEQAIINLHDPNLETIILNPSIMISTSDKEVGRNELNRIPKKLPFYFDFGLNLVNTEDVIESIVSSIENGRPGHRYILGSDNIDAERAFSLTEKYVNLKKPFLKLPYSLLYTFSFILEICSKLKIPLRIKINGWNLNRKMAQFARLKFFYNSDKAKRELNFHPRSIEQSIKEILASLNMTP